MYGRTGVMVGGMMAPAVGMIVTVFRVAFFLSIYRAFAAVFCVFGDCFPFFMGRGLRLSYKVIKDRFDILSSISKRVLINILVNNGRTKQRNLKWDYGECYAIFGWTME